jgi:hypothetical protein
VVITAISANIRRPGVVSACEPEGSVHVVVALPADPPEQHDRYAARLHAVIGAKHHVASRRRELRAAGGRSDQPTPRARARCETVLATPLTLRMALA